MIDITNTCTHKETGQMGGGGKGRRMAKKGVVVMSYNASMPASPKHQKLLFKASAYFTCEEKKQDFFSYNLSVKPKLNSQTGQKTANEILKKKGIRIRPKHSNLY